ncbi:PCRF domain-containing protein, partial [Pelagibacteraceae bacterium]|nr:PCRF domain-containing protein [Pelagibacteraceae bacterium]
MNLRNKTEDQDFWTDPDEAKKVMMGISENEYKINLISGFESKISEVNDYYNLAKEETDEASINECYTSITAILSELEENEFKLQFNGEADSKSCYLE